MSDETPKGDVRCIDDMVRDRLKKPIDADANGRISAGEAWAYTWDLGEIGMHVASDLRDPSKFDELSTAVETIWDEQIAPRDIKLIPNQWEPLLKTLMRSQLRTLIKGVYDLVG